MKKTALFAPCFVLAASAVAFGNNVEGKDEKKEAAPAATATAAPAAATPAAASTAPKKKEWKAARFDGSLIVFDQSIGLGSFVSNEFARNTLYSLALDLQPKYNLTEKLYVGGRFILSKELTNNFATSTTSPGQVTASDLQLSVGYKPLWEPIKNLKLSAAFTTYLPTSLASQYANLVVAFSPSVSLSYKLWKFDLSYGLIFRKNLNLTDSPTVKSSEDIAPVRNGGAEAVSADQTAVGGNNVSFSLTNRLMAVANFTDKLSLTLMLLITNSFAYNSFTVDETSGTGAKAGRGQRDTTWGTIDMSYSLTDHWGLSLGVTSYQSAKTSDGQSIRFPFFDFRSFADNNTSFYFDVSYTF
ncbi:MAG: hypothetical protein HYY84_10555 [Deltaproteobacteria bacterium]|nr:hypothetical protein [Deltaproteobacteria bacterium]